MKKNTLNTILALGFIVLVVVIAIVIGGKSKTTNSYTLKTQDPPTIGPANAKVTVLEFFDFECPACEQLAHTILPALEKQYATSSVQFVYKQFPLPQHSAGKIAAVDSVCAQDQGKFWEYRDLLVKNYPAWTENTSQLNDLAKTAGLNIDQYNTCRNSTAPQQKIDKSFAEGESKGVDATPTLFINGDKIVGVEDLSAYQTKIDTLLKSQ